jgi:hypothetical protein
LVVGQEGDASHFPYLRAHPQGSGRHIYNHTSSGAHGQGGHKSRLAAKWATFWRAHQLGRWVRVLSTTETNALTKSNQSINPSPAELPFPWLPENRQPLHPPRPDRADLRSTGREIPSSSIATKANKKETKKNHKCKDKEKRKRNKISEAASESIIAASST